MFTCVGSRVLRWGFGQLSSDWHVYPSGSRATSILFISWPCQSSLRPGRMACQPELVPLVCPVLSPGLTVFSRP